MSQAVSSKIFYPDFQTLQASDTQRVKVDSQKGDQEILDQLDLATNGPALVVGDIGPNSYQAAPFESEQVDGHKVFAWKKNVRRVVDSKGMAIALIIGETEWNGKKYIYFRLAEQRLERCFEQANYSWNSIGEIYISSLEKIKDASQYFQIKTKKAQMPKIEPFDGMNEWRYIHEEMCSYPLHQLVQSTLSKTRMSYDSRGMTPSGVEFGSEFYELTQDKIIRNMRRSAATKMDWSATKGQEECALSLSEYEAPHLAQHNGHTYSLSSFSELAKHVADTDASARLEDGTILHPLHLKKLELYPNLTFGKTSKIPRANSLTPYSNISSETPRPCNLLAIAEHAEEGFSAVMNRLDMNGNSVGDWDYLSLYAAYAKKRGLPQDWKHRREVMEYLFLEKITFPSKHPARCHTGQLVFRDVILKDSTLNMGCWHSVILTRAILLNCTLDFTEDKHQLTLSQVKMQECTLLYKTQSHLDQFRELSGIAGTFSLRKIS